MKEINGRVWKVDAVMGCVVFMDHLSFCTNGSSWMQVIVDIGLVIVV